MKDHEAGFIHNGIVVPQDEHVNEFHIDEVQPVKCKECNYAAKDSNDLKKHETRQHKKASLEKCRNGSGSGSDSGSQQSLADYTTKIAIEPATD